MERTPGLAGQDPVGDDRQVDPGQGRHLGGNLKVVVAHDDAVVEQDVLDGIGR